MDLGRFPTLSLCTCCSFYVQPNRRAKLTDFQPQGRNENITALQKMHIAYAKSTRPEIVRPKTIRIPSLLQGFQPVPPVLEPFAPLSGADPQLFHSLTCSESFRDPLPLIPLQETRKRSETDLITWDRRCLLVFRLSQTTDPGVGFGLPSTVGLGVFPLVDRSRLERGPTMRRWETGFVRGNVADHSR